ncbi:FAD-binding protein [Nocardia neocaledoniensis NBRC 108232]|uniref:FAD/FMN-containing dehydrogenase n=1 Tax=Nocardia neocaledoniensis TaxID=236511 RepID=A0A317NWQ0_9NOCA|nr:FAD-dependent oxidoreductase [Nocardia neocaledoniensis]PWV79719.1 FAD/FMN-containing dehydrogenase [Nocardia neocaledoniensis]GEM31505.1 FAD-binding protein [Nocardia neocaledoniensis NBRC 108232]
MTTLSSTLATVTPTDKAYRLLRSTYTTVGSPSLILLPRSVDEVSEALTYAASTDLPVSIRSGGHGLSGSASNDGGIVVDLGALNTVSVTDPATGIVRVGAGARWSQVASALSPHELVISSGDHGNVGVGGLATAGGIGWLVRSYGLTIDHVRAATVVLPNGEVVRADAAEPDLFWAIRGAGSYVGVVTDFDIEAEHLPGLQVGQVMIEVDDAGTALRRWSEYMAEAPRELTMSGILTMSGSRVVLAMTAVVAEADPRAAAAMLAPLSNHRGTYRSPLTPARYTELMPPGHIHANLGQQATTTTNALFGRLTEASASALVEVARHRARPLLQVRGIGGAVNDIATDATAYPHRDAEVLVTATLFPPLGGRELGEAVAPMWPHALGAYRNFDSSPSSATFDRAFPGATGERVRELANRYDPDGVLSRTGGGPERKC